MRLSIFSRLIIGYLSLLLLATGVSVYAIIKLSLVKNVTHSIIAVDNNFADLNKKLTDALLSETRYEKKFLIMQDSVLYDSFMQAKKDFGQYLNEALVIADSPDVKDLLDRVRQYHEKYQALFNEEVEFLKTGKQYSRILYKKEKEKVTDSIIEEFKALKILSQKRIFDKIKNLGEAGTRAQIFAIAITAAALLFGGFLSVFITRSITVPLSVMKKKTREIAKGDFEANLDLPSPPEIGELASALNLMCSKLKEVDKMKSDFFSLMSHELRTPLASIKEGTNLFLEGLGGEITEKQKKLLTIIAEESNRLIELVNSLLDLSKMEAGMLRYNFTRSNLLPLIQKVIIEVMPLAEAKDIRIGKNIENLEPATLDPERILQALRNLIGNALKFTPHGGNIIVSAHMIHNGIEVSVTDTGPGIPKEDMDTIFDKFQQVKLKGSGKIKGTGLGLAIVKHIIEKHGGRVWIESTLGKGSTFFFVLPA